MSITNQFPFITVGIYIDKEYRGIVGNSDNQITSMYIIDDIKDIELRNKFIQYGKEWWTETNHTMPINIMLSSKWEPFKGYMKSFITKEFKIVSGPSTSIDSMIEKKPKRKQISLIKRMK